MVKLLSEVRNLFVGLSPVSCKQTLEVSDKSAFSVEVALLLELLTGAHNVLVGDGGEFGLRRPPLCKV
jgi:hypothetical protein